MPIPVNPSLFSMLGRGFRGDLYALDGNHLRWAFDPRLGFPRFAFCVEGRDSVAGDRPPDMFRGATLQLPPGSQPQTLIELVLPEVVAHHRGHTPHLTQSVAGVKVGDNPLVLRFRGQDSHACWVRLRLVVTSPGGSAAASAVYIDRGDPQVVNQARAELAQPQTVDLILTAARIDEVWVTVTGVTTFLEHLTWIRTEDLMADEGWKPLECFPTATSEPDYFERNKELFGGVDPVQVAKERVIAHGPVGAEPLDDPVVPPERPATDVEKQRRYLEPWGDRLEPWLAKVLSSSLGGALHQSEVTLDVHLDDAGQRRGDGVPTRLQPVPPVLTIHPYDAVYAAGLVSFPIALLLGLGCVHRDPEDVLLDYRVRGRWLVEDLWAWVGAAQRRLQSLVDRVAEATPFELVELQAEIVAATQELTDTTVFVQALVAEASEGVVELMALTIGVRPAVQPLFQAPEYLTVTADGHGLPPEHADQATLAVRWELRQRARAEDDTMVPTGACIARTTQPAAGRLDDVRNPNDASDESSPPVAILPAGPAEAAGTAGEATFVDRYADDGVAYLYGVSECDPFGRWSTFTMNPFRWDDLTPPLTPAQVIAELEESGTPLLQVVTVRFAWPLDLADPAGTTFDVHLRRIAPPSAAPVDRAAWGRFERADGTFAPAFVFASGFSGTTIHDGMSMAVSSVDETRTTPSGPQAYRIFEVQASGVVVAYDNRDRAQAWVAVGARNAKGIASVDLGGPAKAEHFRILPPLPPVFPPEPQLATFPDADRRSTFTLAWSAPAGRRSVVYRAGEHELVAMAAQRGIPTSWQAGDPPAQRSAAVRAVAPLLRDAFAAISELLPSGTSAHTDTFGGDLRTLTIYTVVGHSPALVPGPWPTTADGFVAVVVPQIPEPALPVVVRAAWTAAPPPGVELLVAEPPATTAAVGAYDLYRVLEANATRAQDWRQMRPSGRFEVTPSSYVDRPTGPPRVMHLLDDDSLLPWVGYLYRVVARGLPGGQATSSRPSAVVRVVTLDPDPPTPPADIAATGSSAGTELTVTWRATAPDGPAGLFRFEVLDPAGPFTLLRGEATTLRDPTEPTQFAATVPDRGEATEVAVVVIDPTGRRAISATAAAVLT
jgi:hypothetical protein